MWCPSCRADVAAELSTDNRRMLCARCLTELSIAAAAIPQMASPRSAETERDARELLARWSAQNLLDVPAPSVGAGAFAKPNGSTELPTPKSEHRFDLPGPAVTSPSSAFLATARSKQETSQAIPLNRTEQAPLDQEHQTRKKKPRPPRLAEVSIPENPPMIAQPPNQTPVEPKPPHDHDQLHHDELPHPIRHRPSWSTLAGQLCAYAGVGLLTCGTVLVMWSYFGGPPRYMPTGWLIAAIGQMLLFLGVIALISSGMDQTISEVSWRIDHLAEEVHHMGIALDDLEHEHRKARVKRSRSKRRADDGPAREAA